jgi:hypothetical protein
MLQILRILLSPFLFLLGKYLSYRCRSVCCCQDRNQRCRTRGKTPNHQLQRPAANMSAPTKVIDFTRLEAILAAIENEQTGRALLYENGSWDMGGCSSSNGWGALHKMLSDPLPPREQSPLRAYQQYFNS